MAYEHLMSKLDEELSGLDKKVAQGHDLDEKEYMCAKTWAKTLVSLKTDAAMDEEYGDEEYEASYRGQRRDPMGRFSREGGRPGNSYRRSMYPYPIYPSYRGGRNGARNGGGYSYHDGEDDPMMKLQEAYDNAASEQERKTIRKLMEQMEG